MRIVNDSYFRCRILKHPLAERPLQFLMELSFQLNMVKYCMANMVELWVQESSRWSGYKKFPHWSCSSQLLLWNLYCPARTWKCSSHFSTIHSTSPAAAHTGQLNPIKWSTQNNQTLVYLLLQLHLKLYSCLTLMWDRAFH